MDIDTLIKYSKAGPRYTSYPTAPAFHEGFTAKEYREVLRQSNESGKPLSLYFHIPFCRSVCFFCACNVIYTSNQDRADPYLELLGKEMDLIAQEVDTSRGVKQLHWGGGTPTFLTPAQMERLWENINRNFHFTDDAEISIELDPRTATPDHIDSLARCGFNRASLGVQDLDDAVQKAVNRIQPFEITENLVNLLRQRNFRGVNIDLIYGLPGQTVAGFERTLEGILALRPDRISLFHFAYLPRLKKHQNRIKEADLPDIHTRLEIFQLAVNRFLNAGYLYIGMDHFALPNDELALAQQNRVLHRNFQGYTTCRGCDLIGLGLTSIGDIGTAYAQNEKEMDGYARAINADEPAICRGIILSEDDHIRRRAINSLICHFDLRFDELDQEFGINSREYFRQEVKGLKSFADEGLLDIHSDQITVKDTGRFVVRNICMVFDAHLQRLTEKGQTFSRTV